VNRIDSELSLAARIPRKGFACGQRPPLGSTKLAEVNRPSQPRLSDHWPSFHTDGHPQLSMRAALQYTRTMDSLLRIFIKTVHKIR
jgi:hypothetical protein